jgi:hypothetical protein
MEMNQGKERLEQVGEALLLTFPRLSPPEILAALASDTLQQSEIGGYLMCETDTGQCALDDFGIFGSQPGVSPHFTDVEGTWLIVLQAEGTLGATSLLFLDPDEGSTELVAHITDESATLVAEVDLVGAEPLRVAADTEISLDWSDLSRTGQGNGLDTHRLNRLEVARYPVELGELEARFFELSQLAEETITVDIAGITATTIPPLEPGHAWLVALWCDSCNNPVPPFVGRLDVVQP